MTISLRMKIFWSFFALALLNGVLAWIIIVQFTGNAPSATQAVANGLQRGWLFLIFLAGTALLAAAFSYYVSRMFANSFQGFVQATKKLAEADLPRLSEAMSELSDGNLTIQITPQAKQIETQQYMGLESLAGIYNSLVQEVGQVFQKFNSVTDEPCRRMVYVGADSFQEGRMCGDIMGQVLNGSGKVAIVSGTAGQSIETRVSGLLSVLHEKYPGVQAVTRIFGNNDFSKLYPQILEVLRQNPDLSGIYVSDGNSPQFVARALTETGQATKVKLVCHDLVDETMQALQTGVVTATISQDPFAQGYNPVIHLYNYLAAGVLPPRQRMITQMDRITIDNYQQYWDPYNGEIQNETTQARRARAVETLPNRPLRIIVLGREDITFFDPVKQGALSAAQALQARNTIVEWVEPENARDSLEYGAEVYGPAIEEYIAKKYDGIVLPVFDKALVPYINKAVAAGIPVATYNSEPSSLRNLMDQLNQQAVQLRDICVSLAQSAASSEDRANQINVSIGEMTRALNLEVQAAEDAISSTEQISQAMQNISAGAQEQSQAAGKVTIAIEQIAYAVNTTNQTALASEQTAQQAMIMAQQGAETIKQTLEQIEKISGAVRTSVAQIHDLNKISAQINTIVETVNDIAEQTNLLALNAAIEAARVGAEGTGFAVVAAEIRSLADLSRKSTKEISGLIRDVQRNSDLMVKSVDVAMNQAQAGSHLATQAGQALDELMHSSGAMKDQTEKVVEANASVLKSLDDLTGANQRVSAVIEENASATEQVAGNIQKTVDMVNNMTSISKDNSSSIGEIQARSNDVVERSLQLKANIASLVSMAEDLQGAVAAFKIEQDS